MRTHPITIPNKCPECGSEKILAFVEPGYPQAGDSDPTPDWTCDDCGLAGFDTAVRQEEEYRQVRDERQAYEDETGFGKPWKPAVHIQPDNLDRNRRTIDTEPAIVVNGWVCYNCEKDTLTCPVCKATVPIPGIPNGDCWYEPDWTRGLIDELEPQIQQAFNISEVLAEFFICQRCFAAADGVTPLRWFQQRQAK